MNPYQDEECLGRYSYPGLTEGQVTAELLNEPLISKYWHKNSKQIQNRLVQAFMKVPSKQDCPGYIYGFRNQADYIASATSYQIKMGRTRKSVPQQRIFEWQRDDNHKYVQIFTIRSEYNTKLQLLVHLLFAYARKTLIINGKKRIQWFAFDQKVPTAAVVNLLNLAMQKLHEIASKNGQEISKIEEQIELRNETTRKQNKELGRLLEDLKIVLGQFIKTASTIFTQKLKQLVKVNSIKQLKSGLDILLQIIAVNSQNSKSVISLDSDDDDAQKNPPKNYQLIKTLQILRKMLTYVEENESKGMTTKNATEKVKEAFYLILKQLIAKQNFTKTLDSPSSTKTEKKKIIQSQLEEYSQTAFTPEKSTSVRQQSKNLLKSENLLNSEFAQDQMRKLSQFLKGKRHSKFEKLSQVYNQLKSIQDGDTFLNIAQGDFIIDCSKRVKHNIIIMAKTIKTYQTWNITFSSGVQSQLGSKLKSKLKLVIAAKQYINYDKLNIPKQSKNGQVSTLYSKEDGNIIGLDDVLKYNPEKLNNKFYGVIKKIFNQHIK